MRVQRWKHKNLTQQLLGVVQGLAEVLDGLVTVLSLGFLASNFAMNAAVLRVKRQYKGTQK